MLWGPLPVAIRLCETCLLNLIPPFLCRHDTHHDARAAMLARMEALPTLRTMPLLYGRLLPLHRLLAPGAAIQGGLGELQGGQPADGALPPLPPLDAVSLSSKDVDTGALFTPPSDVSGRRV